MGGNFDGWMETAMGGKVDGFKFSWVELLMFRNLEGWKFRSSKGLMNLKF